MEKNPLVCISNNQFFGKEMLDSRLSNKFLKFYMHVVEDASYVQAFSTTIIEKIKKIEETK